MTTLHVEQRDIVVLRPVEPREFSLLQSVMTLCGGHYAS